MKCPVCNRNMSLTKEGVFRMHTISKDSDIQCENSGGKPPEWYTEYKAKQTALVCEERGYLQGERWKEITREAKRLANNRCQICNSKLELQTHHRTYERTGHELQSDLIVLCADCHRLFHEYKNIEPPEAIECQQ